VTQECVEHVEEVRPYSSGCCTLKGDMAKSPGFLKLTRPFCPQFLL
jgi:hypothetical protein